jgi:hypothetical protein
MLHCIPFAHGVEGARFVFPDACHEARATRDSEGSHDMGRNIAFLTRLRQIADACEPGAECPASAVALFNIYLARLYARLDIGQSNRPTHKARAEADSTLAELRFDVLRIEVASAGACADVFAAIRYHIEMARRALAIRITCDDDTQDDWFDGATVRPSATVLIFDAHFRGARHDRMLPLEAPQREPRGQQTALPSLQAVGRFHGVFADGEG